MINNQKKTEKQDKKEEHVNTLYLIKLEWEKNWKK